jgi:D-sedoheptulose 7-phosphate isomerase
MEKKVKFIKNYLNESMEILRRVDTTIISKQVDLILDVKENNGKIFFIGVGGSAANCSHAVNDFRKIAQVECYAPTDNVSELTARTNDEGWDTIFSEWLKMSKISSKDLLFVFSVGGGDLENNISPNIVKGIQVAKKVGASISGIVGKNGGYVTKVSDSVLIIPNVNNDHITPHSESFQAVIWHLLVSHPKLKSNQTKWEGIKR